MGHWFISREKLKKLIQLTLMSAINCFPVNCSPNFVVASDTTFPHQLGRFSQTWQESIFYNHHEWRWWILSFCLSFTMIMSYWRVTKVVILGQWCCCVCLQCPSSRTYSNLAVDDDHHLRCFFSIFSCSGAGKRWQFRSFRCDLRVYDDGTRELLWSDCQISFFSPSSEALSALGVKRSRTIIFEKKFALCVHTIIDFVLLACFNFAVLLYFGVEKIVEVFLFSFLESDFILRTQWFLLPTCLVLLCLML